MPDNPYHAIEGPRPGAIGWRIHYYQHLSSTQEVAARLAASGAEHGTAVIAETQSAGRGRMGRRWHSPPDANLYTTIILRPKISLADAGQFEPRRRSLRNGFKMGAIHEELKGEDADLDVVGVIQMIFEVGLSIYQDIGLT